MASSSSTSPPHHFLNLPPELSLRIIDFVLRSHPKDGRAFELRFSTLKSLCLVNQRGRALAQPELFRRVCLDGAENRERYVEARKHLKCLCATSLWVLDGASAEGSGDRVGKEILELLEINRGLKRLDIRSRGGDRIILDLQAVSELVTGEPSLFSGAQSPADHLSHRS